MKNIFAISCAIMIVLALGTPGMAEEAVKVKGTVAKIDIAARSVTIQPKEGDAVTVIMEDAELLSKVKEGEKGQATYLVKDGKNIGSKLKKLAEGCQ